MQDNLSPTEPKVTHKGLSTPSLICLIASSIILFSLGIIAYSCVFSHIETRRGRMAGLEFPYKETGFVIQSVKTGWKSTDADARLSLRAKFCPYVELKLADISDTGTLFISFANETATPIGDMIALRISQDGFLPSSDSRVKVNGHKVSILGDRGFSTSDDYYLHTIDEMQPFWRINIAYKMRTDAQKNTLGYTSISSDNLSEKHGESN